MIEELKKTYLDKQKVINALNYALYLISWDTETEAPLEALENRSVQCGILYEQLMNIMFSEDFINAVNGLSSHLDELDEDFRIEIKKAKKSLDETLKIPAEEQIKMNIVFATSGSIWEKAKNANDYQIFLPVLKEIVEYQKRVCKYLETPILKGYDVLLDSYEENMTKKEYDEFFDLLRKELVPFVRKITSQKLAFNHEFLSKTYKVNKQKEIAQYFFKVMCLDESFAVLKESAHPFTSGYGTDEIRITTHYYEKDLLSNIYSVIHEAGHATYERNVDKKFNNTLLSGGTSMAMHESQSRFYENIIGRNELFIKKHYPMIQKIFSDELASITSEDFYLAANEAKMSYIRTEADELTYPLHIMLRYELEKELIEGDLTVEELPSRWNTLFKEYFGITVPTDSLGVLQDVHWSGGSFGYFPTYALGSAYAAQLLKTMEKEIYLDKALVKDDLTDIHTWLKEKVHKYGASKSPKDILQLATGEAFNPHYYVEYLKEKYQKIYNLKN